MIIDLVKANLEIGKINKELSEVKADRDAQIAKLAEFEKTNKDYIESAQTAEAMKAEHAAALAAKDAELAAKDAEIVQLKADATKEVAAVKETVAQEAIRIVASQGTNVALETVVQDALTPEKAFAKFQSLNGTERQAFYEANYSLFQSYIKNGSPKTN